MNTEKEKKQRTQYSSELGLQRRHGTCNPKPGPIMALKQHLSARYNKSVCAQTQAEM